MGVSYLEAREVENANAAPEAHFFNTFSLARPVGTIKGRIEAYLFKGGEPPLFVIECNGYRFGVLICYESVKKLQDSGPIDLLLQPFSGPLADDDKPYVKESL
jgi:predicted amidohydrolase